MTSRQEACRKGWQVFFLSTMIAERWWWRQQAGYGDAEEMREYREMTFSIALVVHWHNPNRITKTIGRMLPRGLPLIVLFLVQLRHRVIWWASSFESSSYGKSRGIIRLDAFSLCFTCNAHVTYKGYNFDFGRYDRESFFINVT